MSQKIKHRISLDRVTSRPKSKYHKPIQEGYGQFDNAAFVFSSDLDHWLYGKTRRGAKYPNLF